jgi:hypothetical protein
MDTLVVCFRANHTSVASVVTLSVAEIGGFCYSRPRDSQPDFLLREFESQPWRVRSLSLVREWDPMVEEAGHQPVWAGSSQPKSCDPMEEVAFMGHLGVASLDRASSDQSSL